MYQFSRTLNNQKSTITIEYENKNKLINYPHLSWYISENLQIIGDEIGNHK